MIRVSLGSLAGRALRWMRSGIGFTMHFNRLILFTYCIALAIGCGNAQESHVSVGDPRPIANVIGVLGDIAIGANHVLWSDGAVHQFHISNETTEDMGYPDVCDIELYEERVYLMTRREIYLYPADQLVAENADGLRCGTMSVGAGAVMSGKHDPNSIIVVDEDERSIGVVAVDGVVVDIAVVPEDGSVFVSLENSDGSFGIYSLSLDGAELRPVATVGLPAVSLVGTSSRLFWLEIDGRDLPTTYRVMELDLTPGSEPMPLLEWRRGCGAFSNLAPAADGLLFGAFDSEPPCTPDAAIIGLLPLDGGAVRQVARGRAIGTPSRLRSNGNTIVYADCDDSIGANGCTLNVLDI